MTVPRIVTVVSLDSVELAEADKYARIRREFHRGEGATVPWEERMGTIGEIAVAKHFNLFDQWKENVAYKLQFREIPADVGDNIQVRAIDTGSHGLAVRKSDPIDQAYVLALVAPDTLPVVYLLGWAWGHAVTTRGRWMQDWPRPAFRVGIQHPVIQCMTKFPESCLP